VTRSFLLGLIICVATTGPVNAALLKFTISSEVARVDGWTDPSPLPQTIDVSFVLDTLSGIQGSTQGATGCLQSFGTSGAAFSNISVRAGGRELWTSNGASGRYGGQGLTGSCLSTTYSGYLDVRDDDNFFYGGDLFLFGGMLHEAFQASDDPIANLLMGLQGSAPFTVGGEWGKLRGQAYFQCTIYDTENCVNISAVPLPAAVWLLGTALGLLAMTRKRTKS
jgi:hypothetical protein